jgi:hypothetical protein
VPGTSIKTAKPVSSCLGGKTDTISRVNSSDEISRIVALLLAIGDSDRLAHPVDDKVEFLKHKRSNI